MPSRVTLRGAVRRRGASSAPFTGTSTLLDRIDDAVELLERDSAEQRVLPEDDQGVFANDPSKRSHTRPTSRSMIDAVCQPEFAMIVRLNTEFLEQGSRQDRVRRAGVDQQVEGDRTIPIRIR